MTKETATVGPDPDRPVDPPEGARRQRWLEGGVILAFWGFIIVLTLGQRALDPRLGEPGRLLTGELPHALLEYTLWALLTPGIFWFSRRFRLEGGTWFRHLLLHLSMALVVGFAFDLLGFVTFRAWVVPTMEIPFSFTGRLLSVFFLDEFIIYLVVLAAGFARGYFLQYREHLEETVLLRTQAAELHAHTAELQAQLAEARLQTLRMQINPHFLFNTLHTISTYLERDPRGVRRMIARLSELLRYTLEMTEVKEVPLRQELGFLDGYLEIQSIRFRDTLTIHRDIDAAVLEALVPNLILQPIVENAIKHGVGGLEDEGRIELRAWREEERLHLSVRDNGPGLARPSGDGAASLSQGIGLRNTRERLESLYGAEQSFDLAPAEGGGVVAHISLPYHTAADLFTSTV